MLITWHNLNEKKHHKPSPLQVKWSVPKEAKEAHWIWKNKGKSNSSTESERKNIIKKKRTLPNLSSSRLGVARFSKCILQASMILLWLYLTLSMTSVSVFIAELLLCILSNLWNVLLSS
jgi:hypothetical protein